MFRSAIIRNAVRATTTASKPVVASKFAPVSRPCQHRFFAESKARKDPSETHPKQDKMEDGVPGEGTFARTDPSVRVEHPSEAEYPSSRPAQGQGGQQYKRTLASFSLEGRVGVVTGGARGLGLVMSQAMVISGADVAIVDLNSMMETSSLRLR